MIIRKITALLLVSLLVFSVMMSMNIAGAKDESEAKGHIDAEATIGAHSGVFKIDAKLAGDTGRELGDEFMKIPEKPENSAFNASIVLDEHHLSVKGTFSAVLHMEEEHHAMPGEGMPGMGALLSRPDNLTLQLRVTGSYDPSTNETAASFSASAGFDTKVNETSSHYEVQATGDYNAVHTGVESRSSLQAHIEVSHTFTVSQPSNMQTGAPGFGGVPQFGHQGNLTAHTYIDLTYTTVSTGGVKASNYTIVITTDDSMDWMIYSMLVMMMQYSNASVTVTPSGAVPITGVQNVTITIRGHGENPIITGKPKLEMDAEEFESLYTGPVEGQFTLSLSMKEGAVNGEFDLEVTGNFSQGIYVPANGIWVKQANVTIASLPSEDRGYTIVKGEVTASYENPVPVFLCLKRTLMEMSEEQDGNLYYVIKSGSSNVSFILGDEELQSVTITSDNASLLEDLKIKYGDTIAGGSEYRIVIEIKGSGKKAHVILPHITNETEVEITSHSGSLVIHIEKEIEVKSKKVEIKVKLGDNHMIIIHAPPNTTIMKDINVTVSSQPPQGIEIPPVYKPVGPSYTIDTEINGSVLLGLTVNTSDLDNVKVIWVHKGEIRILDPVSTNATLHVVYVSVPGFSTFIPVAEAAPPQSTTTSQQETSTTTQTTQSPSHTATEQPTFTTSTGSETTNTETSKAGKTTSPTIVLGALVVIILVALLAVYISRH